MSHGVLCLWRQDWNEEDSKCQKNYQYRKKVPKFLLAQDMCFKVAITFEGVGLWRSCVWAPKPTTNGLCGDGNVRVASCQVASSIFFEVLMAQVTTF